MSFASLYLLTLLSIFTVTNEIKCSQCTSDQDPWCMIQSPAAIPCPSDLFQYCLIVEEFNKKDEMISFTRSCSPEWFGTTCNSSFVNTYVGKLCVRTCSSDACNYSYSSFSNSSSSYLMLSILSIKLLFTSIIFHLFTTFSIIFMGF